MKNRIISTISLLALAAVLSPLPTAETASEVKAYLKDGKIVTERQSAQDQVEPSQTSTEQTLQSDKWQVRQQSDPVQEALKVYKKKSEPLYRRTIWLTDRGNGAKSVVIEYLSKRSGDRVIFSPDEDFVYYLGVGSEGTSIVYGFNLSSQKQFSLASGNDYGVITCPDQKSYVIVEQNDQGVFHHVFLLSGQKKDVIRGAMTMDEIKQQVCY